MLRARTRRSLRRSRVRERVIAHLAQHGRTDARALMRATGLPWRRLLEVVDGGTERYRREESPVELGLVRRVRAATGVAFELTERGRREWGQVESLRAREVPL